MQKLQNNPQIQCSSLFSFSPYCYPHTCFPLPNTPQFWDYRNVPPHPDLSLNFIHTLRINVMFCHQSQRKAGGSAVRHAQQLWNCELASESPSPQQPSCKQKGVKGKNIFSSLRGVKTARKIANLRLQMLIFRELWQSHAYFHKHERVVTLFMEFRSQ